MKPVFVALTDAGLATARRAADAIGGEVLPIADVRVQIRSLFTEGRPIVGICAAGILIRILAPLLADKRDEPPVVALSEDGASIVPLLGGHRGANDLARRLAEALGGHAAITTAGDNRFGIALDAPPEGWTLANPATREGRDGGASRAAPRRGSKATRHGWRKAAFRSRTTARSGSSRRRLPLALSPTFG